MLKIVLKIFSLILLLTIAFSTFSVFIYADENNISNDVTNIETKPSDSTKTDVEAKIYFHIPVITRQNPKP